MCHDVLTTPDLELTTSIYVAGFILFLLVWLVGQKLHMVEEFYCLKQWRTERFLEDPHLVDVILWAQCRGPCLYYLS